MLYLHLFNKSYFIFQLTKKVIRIIRPPGYNRGFGFGLRGEGNGEALVVESIVKGEDDIGGVGVWVGVTTRGHRVVGAMELGSHDNEGVKKVL